VLDGAGEGDIVVAVHAPSGTRGATLHVAWIRGDGDARATMAARSIAVAPFTPSVYGPAPTTRLVRVARAPSRPPGAHSLSLTVMPGAAGDAVTLDDPVVVAPRSLTSVLEGRSVLVSPPELPILRCTTPPLLHLGVAAMPDAVIGFERREGVDEIGELGSPTGPWFLAGDAYATSASWGWLSDTDAFAVTLLRPRPGDAVVPIEVRRG
jgi:hypothetical protein